MIRTFRYDCGILGYEAALGNLETDPSGVYVNSEKERTGRLSSEIWRVHWKTQSEVLLEIQLGQRCKVFSAESFIKKLSMSPVDPKQDAGQQRTSLLKKYNLTAVLGSARVSDVAILTGKELQPHGGAKRLPRTKIPGNARC